jgi:hypothetical protein
MTEKNLYGKAKNGGKALHFVIESADGSKYFSRCNQKLEIDEKTVSDEFYPISITCKKCQRFAAYKNFETEPPKPQNPLPKTDPQQKIMPTNTNQLENRFDSFESDAIKSFADLTKNIVHNENEVELLKEKVLIMAGDRESLIEKKVALMEEKLALMEERIALAEDRSEIAEKINQIENMSQNFDRLEAVTNNFSSAFGEAFRSLSKITNDLQRIYANKETDIDTTDETENPNDETDIDTTNEDDEKTDIEITDEITDVADETSIENSDDTTNEDEINELKNAGVVFISDSEDELEKEVSGDPEEILKKIQKRNEETDKPNESANKVTEENYKEKLKETQKNDNITVDGEQFKKVATGKDDYIIIHIATGQKMFDNIPEKIANTAIKYLNNMRIRWENKNDPVPTDFVSACAAAFRAACSNHGFEIKIGSETNLKPPRVISRRPQKPARKIKRRQKAEQISNKNRFGFRNNTVKNIISSMLEEGAHFFEIKEKCQETFDLDEKKIKNRVQAVIRKLKKDGYSVAIIDRTEHEMNFYEIVDLKK